MDEICPICLEENNPNMCCNEVCFTCRKIFCKKCLNPENHAILDICPHCKTPFVLDIDKDIERCLKIINRPDEDFKHKGIIHYYLYSLYEEKNDSVKSDYHLNQSLKGNCNCAYTVMANKYSASKNSEEFEKYIKIASDKGCLTALVSQAEIEVKKGNKEKAKELLVTAAEYNQKNAQYLLGLGIYENEIEGDDEEAIKWLTKSADRNHRNACFYLANIYYNYRDDEEKYQLAVKYILKAAKLNHPDAQYNYAIVLHSKNDYYQAIEWYYKAYHNGKKEAITTIAECYFSMASVLGDFVYYEGLRILEQQVEEDNPSALYELGYLYYTGNQYIMRDDEKAFQLINKSAELNYTKSYLTLSEMYIKGIGVTRDVQKGYTYAARYLFTDLEDIDIQIE